MLTCVLSCVECVLSYEQQEEFSNSQLHVDALEAAGGTIEVDTGNSGAGECYDNSVGCVK